MLKDLYFVTPESEGLSSENVLRFIELMKKRKVNLHSFLIYRNGNILAEAYTHILQARRSFRLR